MYVFSMPVKFDLAYTNLAGSIDALTSLIVAISYLTGVFLVLRGVMMYRMFANQTYGSAQRGEMAGPLVFLLVGVVLIYFPSTISSANKTVFGIGEISHTSEILGYVQENSFVRWMKVKWVILKYLSLVGMIAFLRGWIILSKMGHSGSQPGSVGKGITHVVGGILLINIVQTVQILAKTFGYQL